MPRPIGTSDRVLRSHSRNMANNNQAPEQQDQEQNAPAPNQVPQNDALEHVQEGPQNNASPVNQGP